MTIFKRKSGDDRYPLFYVLDACDREAIDAELEKLEECTKDFTLDLRKIDWKALSNHLSQLGGQLRDGRDQEPSVGGHRQETAEGTSLALVPIVGVLAPHPGASTQAFLEAASAIVRDKQDPHLTASWKHLSQQMQAPGDRAAAIDYFAWFFPDLRAIAHEPPVLRRIFDALAAALKRMFSTASSSLVSVWDVVRNPDPYFLRLRGEITEWARRNQVAPIADQLFLVPDLFRLYVRLLCDDRVALRAKAELVGALAYLIWPFDVLPEGIIGPAGYLDDSFVLLKTLTSFIDQKNVHPDVLRAHWSGTAETLQQLLDWAAFCESHLPFFGTVATWWVAR